MAQICTVCCKNILNIFYISICFELDKYLNRYMYHQVGVFILFHSVENSFFPQVLIN